jgi:hypothetical protein
VSSLQDDIARLERELSVLDDIREQKQQEIKSVRRLLRTTDGAPAARPVPRSSKA